MRPRSPDDTSLDWLLDSSFNATHFTALDADAAPRRKVQRYRTIWISDLHLGLPETKVDYLHDFLKSTESEKLYLVGDIIDLWKLRNGWHWPAVNNSVIRRILHKAKHGTEVIYIPGNHDDLLREYLGLNFGGIKLIPRDIHIGADGQRYLVLHGDEFDTVVTNNRLLSLIGSEAYGLSLKLNRYMNFWRRKFGYEYWSLSAFLKSKVKNAVMFVSKFENAVVDAARETGVDGVVCGHIHCPALTEIDGIRYCNDGDWVESCTALVEHFDGRLELLRWAERPSAAKTEDADQADSDDQDDSERFTDSKEDAAIAHRDRKRRLVPAG